jgi:hypothetical protein
MSEEKKPVRLPSIYNQQSANENSNTTKGGAQKLKFTPTVPSTRAKKDVPEPDIKREPPQAIPTSSIGRRGGRGRGDLANRPHQNHAQYQSSAFSEGPAAFSSGIKTSRYPSSSTSQNERTPSASIKSESSVVFNEQELAEEVDSAIDMKDLFSAINSLHTPLIIDGSQAEIVDEDRVQVPPEGQLFLLQVPFPIDKLKHELVQSRLENEKKKSHPIQLSQQKAGETVLDIDNLPDTSSPQTSEWHWSQRRGKVGSLKMYESGRSTLTINGIEYDLESNVVNLRNNFKVVQLDLEKEAALDFGSIQSKQLTASFSGEFLINNL